MSTPQIFSVYGRQYHWWSQYPKLRISRI